LKREKDFRRFAGQKVRVALFAPWQGEKNRVGSLGEVTSDSLGLVDENGESLKIPRELIARVNLYWDGYEEG
jgi:ribosome maturation factor RimP